MTIRALLSTWGRRLTPFGRDGGRLRLHYLGMSEADLRQLRPMVEGVATRLGVALDLDADRGDIVVVERGFAAHLSTHALQAYCEERPLVAIDVAGGGRDAVESTLQHFEHRQRDLLSQLSDIPMVRRVASHWGELDATPRARPPGPASDFDPAFDSRLDGVAAPALDPHQQALVDHLRSGLAEPALPTLVLGYGPGACMEVHFAQGRVFMDPAAQQRLRIGCELPSVAPPGARTGLQVSPRDLDLVVWDMGLACGDHLLLGQPPDWWHTALRVRDLGPLDRMTRLPRHLDMGRRLLDGPVTPSQLRRHALVSVRELRRFIQACLFLELVAWDRRPGR